MTDYHQKISSMRSIAALVRLHRRQAGLSQSMLAELAGLGRSAIQYIERGEETVQWNTLFKVLRILNMSVYISGPFVKDDVP